MDAAQPQRKLTDFDASSAISHLDQKVVKAELFLFFWLNTTSF